jgi:hypothetical protein
VAILLHLPLGLFGALELGDFGLAVIELRHRTKVDQICVLVHRKRYGKARARKEKRKGSVFEAVKEEIRRAGGRS